jgi:ankyrin repeat protein
MTNVRSDSCGALLTGARHPTSVGSSRPRQTSTCCNSRDPSDVSAARCLDLTDEAPAVQNEAALHRAAFNGDTAMVAELARLGADVNARGTVSEARPWRVLCLTAAPTAAQSGKTALTWAAYKGHTATAAELVRLGTDINAKTIVRIRCSCACAGRGGRGCVACGQRCHLVPAPRTSRRYETDRNPCCVQVGSTARDLASLMGHHEIVELLTRAAVHACQRPPSL